MVVCEGRIFLTFSYTTSQYRNINIKKFEKTYNSRCSLMVTHSTTNLPVSGLSMGEQTGPRILHYLWSYVFGLKLFPSHMTIAVVRRLATVVVVVVLICCSVGRG
ncbi:hypothetical protein M441DRAFT_144576 [Trichoderma asperellum CBS 433.97]|uniref:Uncharacterized protein n=1 Tax=Trichoderma asperellum (strain ATCC 204424 / CBS 433.97 / NBRC 101777) TaxID=1042311 RepID=A0A2T3Z3P2_TRIA4|nr:hypothetical protein M441DRAFT_144576 [Trichoderma asperellum CBS 433.97]PTB39436.1 hypothetical protein M441DRAFT_144576 [Trichoderma asperellum CBS 433.97]